MITEDKISLAHNDVKGAVQDIQELIYTLDRVSENLSYRSFAYDVVSECLKMIYIIKSKLDVVEKITDTKV